MTNQELMIKVAKELHKAVLGEIELMMDEDSDPDSLIDAIVKFETVYFPITPKDRRLVKGWLRDNPTDDKEAKA